MVYGYVGKILRVDLSTGNTTTLNTLDYVPDFIGGIGLGYRLLWDEINEKTAEFSPENPLIFATGPLTGTPSPTSSRSEIIGLAPQSYPKPWAAPSGFGGDFGPKLKFAGYDALIVTGKAKSPKYLYISEEKVEIMDAASMWGLCTFPTQEAMINKHGEDIAVACIGPAGENLVRWAIVLSGSDNAAGQGGYGALMGDKKLKAVVVRPGAVKVPVADPEKLIAEVVKVTHEINPGEKQPLTRNMGNYTTRQQSCAWSGCTGRCLPSYYNKIPQKVTGFDTISGVVFCVGGSGRKLAGGPDDGPDTARELGILCDMLGLNQWEAFKGVNFFFMACSSAGKLPRIMGEDLKLNPDSPAVYPKTVQETGLPAEWGVKFLKAIALREGDGDIWAEGVPRAAEKFGLEAEARKTHKHGYGPHWDGRYDQFIRFPVWVVSALSWATQGRDPYNQQHGYVERYPAFVKEWSARPPSGGRGKPDDAVGFAGAAPGDQDELHGGPFVADDDQGAPAAAAGQGRGDRGATQMSYAEICKAGARLYGVPHANDGWDKPEFGYIDKEYVGIWHENRAIVKSSVTACDRAFPLLYDVTKPDKLGDTEAELRLFNAVVGANWSVEDMKVACDRVFTMMRAIHVRQGRTREDDESILAYFEQPDMWPDDAGPSTIDRKLFGELLDRYYDLRGWDRKTGWPIRAHMEKLGLRAIADKLYSLRKLT